MSDNGKDQDVEVVQGIDPKAKAIAALGFRVSKVGVKETDGGGTQGDATVVGMAVSEASDLIPVLGQEVALGTAGDGRRHVGLLRSITFAAGKDDKPGKVTIKVTGGRGLDLLVGVGVKVTRLQQELPLSSKPEKQPARRKGREAAAPA